MVDVVKNKKQLPSFLLWRRNPILWTLIVVCILAYFPAAIATCFGAWPFADDALANTGVWRGLTRTAFGQGLLPLWNPHLFCGMPFMSNGQAGVFYPSNVLYWVMPVRVALLLDAIFHNILLACGAYTLARALGLSRLAAWVTTVSFALSTAVSAHVYAGHVNWHAARAYLPWELWALLCYLRTGQARYGWGLSIAFALQMASGYPPLVLLSGGLCVGLCLAWLITRSVERLRLSRQQSPTCPPPIFPAGWPSIVCGAGLLVLLLTAVHLGPLRELSRLTMHGSGMSYQEVVQSSASWRTFVRLMAPNFFGGNQPLQWSIHDFPHEEAAYTGLLPLILALGTPFFARRSITTKLNSSEWIRQGALPVAVPWLWGLLALSVLLALGGHTPLYRWLFNHVFLFRITRPPVRWLEVWALAVALLAGFAFDGSFCDINGESAVPEVKLKQVMQVLQLVLWGIFAFFLGVALLVLVSPRNSSLWLNAAQELARNLPPSAQMNADDIARYFQQAAMLEAATVSLFAGLMASLCARWLKADNQVQRQRLERVIMAVVVLDLLCSFWRSTRIIPAQEAALNYSWPSTLTQIYKPGQRWDTDVDWININYGMPLEIDVFNGYDALNTRRYFDFVGSFEGPGVWSSGYQPHHQVPLLCVAGVTHTLTSKAKPSAPLKGATDVIWQDGTTRMRRVAQAGAWSLWQHKNVWPRIYLSRRVLRVSDAQQLGSLSALAEQEFTDDNRPVVVLPNTYTDVHSSLLQPGDKVISWN
ncbi:MAG: hypothetical protein JOZ57_00480, partial [Abitibacteriaceae bacterium]|nr:hypothetical protein [Abditibacteriaceae bacterium]